MRNCAPRLAFAALALPSLLALGGCGSGSGEAPVACTHHLVYVSAADTHEKLVALTFDDGPGPYAQELFDVLRSHHVPGTFFMVGERVAKHLEEHKAGLLHEIMAAGMEIGNHSYDHPRDLPDEGEGASLQLEITNREIFRASGFEPCLFRPPYGNVSPELIQRAKVLGMTTVKWDVDPADWTHPGAAVIRERVLADVGPGSIVDMHDNAETRGQTAEALPGIIEGLKARGYRFLTVTQLLGDAFITGTTSASTSSATERALGPE